MVMVTCWYRGSGLIGFFDQLRLLCSRLIKALRTALRTALHRAIGSVSVQLIKALGIRSYRAAGALPNSRGGIEFC
jgi:hypothetical protein